MVYAIFWTGDFNKSYTQITTGFLFIYFDYLFLIPISQTDVCGGLPIGFHIYIYLYIFVFSCGWKRNASIEKKPIRIVYEMYYDKLNINIT